MDAKISWKGKMSFVGVGDSGHEVPMDATEKVGGEDRGSRPTELVLIGLGGCTGMDVISILQKKKQDVTAFDILVHGEKMDTHPKYFKHIVVEFVVTGHSLSRDAVERAVELSRDKYCSVQAMLRGKAEIETKVTILEAE